MLDTKLCEIIGIDDFTQWIMKELDYLEDELYSSGISPTRYIEIKGKYEQMKDVRDQFQSYLKNKK